eukprot:972844-Pyramimonas_sp.AAC.1
MSFNIGPVLEFSRAGYHDLRLLYCARVCVLPWQVMVLVTQLSVGSLMAVPCDIALDAKNMCVPLHRTPPPPLPRLIRFSRVPGISLFW